MSRISAIVTCYNVEEYVATAMQSVIDAGFDDLELIVVDDGSSDATRSVIDLVGGMAPSDRVRFEPIYFSQNTIGGVACAANAGLDRATGDVVVFVDGDDWVLPHALAEAVDLLLAEEADRADFIVCGCSEYWNSNGNYSRYPEMHLWDQLPHLETISARREVLLGMAPFPWRKIYRRDFLERHHIRFPVGDFLFEDNPFHWETSMRADTFLFYEPVTHIHRMDRAGQTVSSMGLKPLQIFEHATTIRQQLEETGRMQILRAHYLQWLIKHVLWCCTHVPVHGLNRVYDLSLAHLQEFASQEICDCLAEQERSIHETRRIVAIREGSRLDFLREF